MLYKFMMIVISVLLLISCSSDSSDPNLAPLQPQCLYPANYSSGISTTPTLSWSCSDPEEDELIYTVLLDTINDPAMMSVAATDLDTTSYTPSALNFDQEYFWQISVSDGFGVTTSEVFSFNTETDEFSLEMKYIPGGVFLMGNTHDTSSTNNLPVHTVSIDPFYLQNIEISHEKFIALFNWALGQDLIYCNGYEIFNTNGLQHDLVDLNDTDCAFDYINNEFVFQGNNFAATDQSPAFEITWFGAVAFCNFLSIYHNLETCYDFEDWSCNWSASGYRLPTEAEWEYAARETNDNPDYQYAGSDSLQLVAWYQENSQDTSHPGALLEPNNLGLYDMTGNLGEWVWDWYDENYYYSSAQLNPRGPSTGSARVVRGGAFTSMANACILSQRYNAAPSGAHQTRGFRIARKADI